MMIKNKNNNKCSTVEDYLKTLYSYLERKDVQIKSEKQSNFLITICTEAKHKEKNSERNLVLFLVLLHLVGSWNFS